MMTLSYKRNFFLLLTLLIVFQGCTGSLQKMALDGAVPSSRAARALILACERGQVDMVVSMLDQGLDVNITGPEGITPLMAASSHGQVPVVKLLLDRGAAVDSHGGGDAPLLLAAQNRHDNIQLLLIDQGASLDVYDDRGWTPFLYALESQNLPLAETYLAGGASVDYYTRDGDTTFIRAIHKGNRELIAGMLDAGILIETPDSEGWTPLMHAVMLGDLSKITLLLDRGADINSVMEIPDGEGDCLRDTPLHVAVYYRHEPVVRELIRRGADPNVKNRWSQTPLYYAIDQGELRLAELLVEAGADGFKLTNHGDDFYVSAKSQQLVAMNLESKGNRSGALAHYESALNQYNRAVPLLMKEIRRYKSRRFWANVYNVLQVVGAAAEVGSALAGDGIYISDWAFIPTSEIKKYRELKMDFEEKTDDCRISIRECRNIIQYLKGDVLNTINPDQNRLKGS